LHGTNSALGDTSVRPVATPRAFRCGPTRSVRSSSPIRRSSRTGPRQRPEHWLVEGVESFEATDELYLNEYHDRDQLHPLLHTTWSGSVAGFADSDWTTTDPTQLVMYLRPLGDGAVLYNTLATVAVTTT
jgi:hypothetical protein